MDIEFGHIEMDFEFGHNMEMDIEFGHNIEMDNEFGHNIANGQYWNGYWIWTQHWKWTTLKLDIIG